MKPDRPDILMASSLPRNTHTYETARVANESLFCFEWFICIASEFTINAKHHSPLGVRHIHYTYYALKGARKKHDDGPWPIIVPVPPLEIREREVLWRNRACMYIIFTPKSLAWSVKLA